MLQSASALGKDELMPNEIICAVKRNIENLDRTVTVRRNIKRNRV